MDLVIEFIVEVVLEGIIELIKNKKISKWIRYPLLIIISLFYLFILGALAMILPAAFKENIFIGIIMSLVEGILILGVIYILKETIGTKDN